MNFNQRIRPITLSLMLAGGAIAAPLSVSAGQDMQTDDQMSEEVREAWMEGKLETALLFNRHLNNFSIDSEVNDTEVVLEGTVASDVDRDLAEQIALSVDGIESVDNELEVQQGYMQKSAESTADDFASRVEDATLTAEVKLKLLANSNTEGLDVNVDTSNGIVTLQGAVESDSNKDLAEQIAANVTGVKKVENELRVNS